MRDDIADSVTPGGPPAPLGARGLVPGPSPGGDRPSSGRPAYARLGGPTRLLVALLAGALVVYAAVAADVVNAGPLSEVDVDVATWVARSMPTWAEWLARPFTWLGGFLGLTAVVAAAVTWLLARGARGEAALLVTVAIGIQLIVVASKNGYDRPRPDVGSAIALPSSFSFPSGHAANGIAVLGLLGLIAAAYAHTTARKGDRGRSRDSRSAP